MTAASPDGLQRTGSIGAGGRTLKSDRCKPPPLGLGGDPSIRYVSFFSASSYSTEPAAGDAAGLRCNLRSDACWQVMSAGRKAL